MKNSVKLFGLVVACAFMFSCSTDEQDADLERAIKMSENMKKMQEKGDNQTGTAAKEAGTPVIIVKRD